MRHDRRRTCLRATALKRRRQGMRRGFKVFDTDTHVLPAAEVIEHYVDPDFRPRLKELEPYRTPMRQSAEYEGALHGYRIQPQLYRRVLGEAAARPDHSGRLAKH